MSIKTEAIRAKNTALTNLTQTRDEGRVRLHLLSLEARQRWDELETAITALERRAAKEGEHLGEALTEKSQLVARQLRAFMVEHLAGSAGLLTSVRSVMTGNVFSCSASDSLNKAAHLMWENDCGIVPALEDSRVIGLLTDRDVCMATYTQGKAPADISVSSAMSSQVYSCAADDSIGDALSLMAEKQVRRLPVLGSDGQLVGMVTLADIARFARSAGSPHVDAALAETLGAISKGKQALPLAAE